MNISSNLINILSYQSLKDKEIQSQIDLLLCKLGTKQMLPIYVLYSSQSIYWEKYGTQDKFHFQKPGSKKVDAVLNFTISLIIALI